MNTQTQIQNQNDDENVKENTIKPHQPKRRKTQKTGSAKTDSEGNNGSAKPAEPISLQTEEKTNKNEREEEEKRDEEEKRREFPSPEVPKSSELNEMKTKKKKKSKKAAGETGAAMVLIIIKYIDNPVQLTNPRVLQKKVTDLFPKAINARALPFGDVKVWFSSPEEAKKALERPTLRSFGPKAKAFPSMAKEHKLVAYGIPSVVSRDDIKSVLKEQGFTATKVDLYTPKNSKIATAFISLASVEEKARLLSRKSLSIGFSRYRVKDYETRRATQCYKCQKFGHVTRTCREKNDTCRLCAESHDSKTCPSRPTTRRCANCQQNHAASYIGCKVRQNEDKKVKSILSSQHKVITPKRPDIIGLPAAKSRQSINNFVKLKKAFKVKPRIPPQ